MNLQDIENKLTELSTCIYGNGKQGMKGQLNTVRNDIKWVIRVGGAVALMVTAIFVKNLLLS